MFFENYSYNKLLAKMGITGDKPYDNILKVLIPLAICWLPLVVITLINGTFWTGDSRTSFISNLDTQTRVLISVPIMILAERIIMPKLGNILAQFIKSGIVRAIDQEAFNHIVKQKTRFLNSPWTDLTILAVSYAHVLLTGFVESPDEALLSWQFVNAGMGTNLSLAGWWSLLLTRPAVLFLFYRWLVRIFVWAILLREISKLKLNIYPVHPDLSGGLGFLGYSIRYFTPVAFAISASVAGRMIDSILIGGSHLDELRVYAFLFLLLITLLFTLPLMSFTASLMRARDKAIYENNDFANGLFRELQLKMSKDFDKVDAEDLQAPDYSASADLSSVIGNALKMRFIPFDLRDLIPLWLATAAPFVFVAAAEVPVVDLVKKLLNLIV